MRYEATGDGTNALIFVSCGQYLDAERELGEAVAKIISEETAAEGYFAQNQTSFTAVSTHIIDALARCVGFVGIMHHRGRVKAFDTPEFDRGSVWVEQEIAIAAYRAETSSMRMPVLLYVQEGIRLEGLREKVMLNPVRFTKNEEVLEDLRARASAVFGTAPVQTTVREVADSGIVVELPNRESPLGQKQFREVFLGLNSANPDFIIGAQITPWSYIRRRTLDQDDEEFIEEVGELTRGNLGRSSLHKPLSLRRIADGVVLTTPDTNRKRQDNTRVQPEQQIEVLSNGDMVIRFEQNDESPIVQVLAVLGVAYTFIREVYSRFGLDQRAYLHFVVHLHAGRSNFTPALPMDFSYNMELDLKSDDFVAAFSDMILELFRRSDYTSNRAAVHDTLRRFAQESLPPPRR